MQNLQSLTRLQSSARHARRGAANIIQNGSFEFAPPFTAVTTSGGKWIDGTAAGSDTNVYKWRAEVNAGAMAFRFDNSEFVDGTYSMKISTTNATGRGYVSTGTGIDLTPVRASTAYRLRSFIKTNNVATNGVGFFVAYFDSSRNFVDGSFSSFISGTNPWALFQHMFTTQANTAFVEVQLLNFVAGNVSDAWFDKVQLIRS